MPRKGENIYKRKDGRWEARYIKQRNTDGKALYGYVYAKSYKEVKIKLNKQLINLSPGIAKPKNIQNNCGISFHAFAKEWYMSILPQVKESTGNKYGNILTSYIIPGLANPSKSQELLSAANRLSSEQLDHLIAIAKGLK